MFQLKTSGPKVVDGFPYYLVPYYLVEKIMFFLPSLPSEKLIDINELLILQAQLMVRKRSTSLQKGDMKAIADETFVNFQ